MEEIKQREQIVIQEKIDEAISDEFNNLLKENKKDKLLQLLIKDELDNMTIEVLKEILSED